MKKPTVLLLTTLSLSGCELNPIYQATFTDGSLKCCITIDRIPGHATPQPLAMGHSQVADSRPIWFQSNGNLGIGITDPESNPDTASAGVFSTGLDFGPGTEFAVRATFQRPFGPHETDKAWAAGSVVARTGDRRDLEAYSRVNAALKVNGSSVRLNLTETIGTVVIAKTYADVQSGMYDGIFKMDQPYTIELHVDRKTGKATATLTTGTEPPLLADFNMKCLGPCPGEAITTVGATVAITDSPRSSVWVEVHDFQISK